MPAKPSVWQQLQSDLSFSKVREVLAQATKPSARGQTADADAHVERILEAASARAAAEGRTVEEILVELGFDVAAPAVTSPQARRHTMQTMDWEPVGAASTRSEAPQMTDSPASVDPAKAVLDRFDGPRGSDWERILERMKPGTDTDRRLMALGGGVDPRAAASSGAVAYWRHLAGLGVSPENLELLARTEPGAPPAPGEQASDDVDDFFDFLLARDALRFKEFKKLETEAKSSSTPLLEMVRAKKLVDEDTLATLAAEFAGVEYLAEPTAGEVPDALISTLAGWADPFRFVPIAVADDNLTVATAMPLPTGLLDRISNRVRLTVSQVVVPQAAFAVLYAPFSKRRSARPVAADVAGGGGGVAHSAQIEKLRKALGSASAVELVRQVLEGAIEARATDIHVESLEEGGRVRYRIDGQCLTIVNVPRATFSEAVARIKVLAELDTTEKRRPQDGHLRAKVGKRTVDMRIATVPTHFGEKVAIRLADPQQTALTLRELGLDEVELEVMREVSTRSYGMVLATGPVGSGKTTTLYACLSGVDRTRNHVVSIEDPVEIDLEGANQVEVNYAIGFGFVEGLRALLRQDPDVLLIGEVRDEETARIAIRASMTGRMVYSTLHANDSVGAITTLRNFHIPGFLIGNNVQGVIAQRLVRKICNFCKVEHSPDPEELRLSGVGALPEGATIYRGTGCDACYGTGYSGRTGVFEILALDRTMRDLIATDAPESEIRAYAMSRGLRTLQEKGVAKILEGVTSIEEFARVLRI